MNTNCAAVQCFLVLGSQPKTLGFMYVVLSWFILTICMSSLTLKHATSNMHHTHPSISKHQASLFAFGYNAATPVAS